MTNNKNNNFKLNTMIKLKHETRLKLYLRISILSCIGVIAILCYDLTVIESMSEYTSPFVYVFLGATLLLHFERKYKIAKR